MESFKLKVDKRNKLYFNKYKYRAVLHVKGVAYTYYAPDLNTFIKRLETTKARSSNMYKVSIMDDSYRVYWDTIDINQISDFINWRNNTPKNKFMYRVQGDHVSFFSDELDLLKKLKLIDPNMKLSEAEVIGDKDTMYFKKEPKFKFRTYFKAKRMPEDFSETIRDMHNNCRDLHFSSSLLKILFYTGQYNRFRYMHGSHYVEYNSESMLSMLYIKFSGMVAKTYSCKKQP